jgi:hypothetical protein
MSHFTTIKTRLGDVSALVVALNDIGFKEVELHETAQHLFGYQGDQRQQTAEVIVRRRYLGRASNDLGFKRSEDGTFTAIISEYDRSTYDHKWIQKLMQRYAYRASFQKLKEQGFDLVKEENSVDGQIHLLLRRMA